MGPFLLTTISILILCLGFVLGTLWASRSQSKVLQRNLEKYRAALMIETERTRQIQQQITEYYQNLVKQDMYDHMLETADPPPSKDEMN